MPEVGSHWPAGPGRLARSAKAHLSGRSTNSARSSQSPRRWRSIDYVDRQNLAKYLTIAKLKLENAIAQVRAGEGGSRT